MKSSRKLFIISEMILAAALTAVAFAMLREQSEREMERVSVIIQDSDASQWAAFKYGLRMAAEDFKMEVSVVGTEGDLTTREEQRLIERELENGTNAVIVQPAQDGGAEEMLKKIGKKIPVMQVESKTQEDSALPCTAPDNYAMGEAVAGALLSDCGGSLEGKTVGMLAGDEKSEAIKERRKGLCETIKDKGGEIIWSISGLPDGEEEQFLQKQSMVDFIIALDDGSLVQAGKEAAARDLHGALVYGIGNSTEAVYYVDSGNVECLVVPDEFNIGYQAFAEAANRVGSRFYNMQDRTVSHMVLRRENLFSEENQEILFTMNQ